MRSGSLHTITLTRLRAAARRLWLERRRSALAASSPPVDLSPVNTLAELSDLERTVIVLRLVNHMPIERVAEALDLTGGWVADVERRAIREIPRGVPARGQLVRINLGKHGNSASISWTAVCSFTRCQPRGTQ